MASNNIFDPQVQDVQKHQKPAQPGGATVVQTNDGGTVIATNNQPPQAANPLHLQENLMIAPTGGLVRAELPTRLGEQKPPPPIPCVCEWKDDKTGNMPCRDGAGFECYQCGTFLCQRHRVLWQSKYVCKNCQQGVKQKTGGGCGECTLM